MCPDTDGVTDDARTEIELSLTVVRYADGPDRCTMYPPGAAGDARLSTWLSVDRRACLELAAMR